MPFLSAQNNGSGVKSVIFNAISASLVDDYALNITQITSYLLVLFAQSFSKPFELCLYVTMGQAISNSVDEHSATNPSQSSNSGGGGNDGHFNQLKLHWTADGRQPVSHLPISTIDRLFIKTCLKQFDTYELYCLRENLIDSTIIDKQNLRYSTEEDSDRGINNERLIQPPFDELAKSLIHVDKL